MIIVVVVTTATTTQSTIFVLVQQPNGHIMMIYLLVYFTQQDNKPQKHAQRNHNQYPRYNCTSAHASLAAERDTLRPQIPKPNHFHPPPIHTIHFPLTYFLYYCRTGETKKKKGRVTAWCTDKDRPKICHVARPFT